MENFNENKGFNKRLISLLFFKYSKLLILIIIVIISLMSIFFLIKPKYTKMKETSDIILRAKLDKLSSMEAYLKKLKDYNKSYKNFSEEDINKISKIIPFENDYQNLVLIVNDIVSNRRLTLKSISIDGAVQKTETNSKVKKSAPVTTITNEVFPSNVKKIQMTINVEGVDYNSMKLLISDFEKSLRLFDIEKTNFSEGSESINMTISTYYFES